MPDGVKSPGRSPEIFDFYSRALREGQTDHARVGWESAALQKLRFEALLQAFDTQPRSHATLLDVGCGLGDLVPYLAATGRDFEYTGVDIHPAMIAEARQRYPDARFEVADVFELADGAYDFVLCSGALSLRFASEEDSYAFIDKLHQIARLASAFNLQSKDGFNSGRGHALRSDFWHVAPVEVYTRLRATVPNIVLREDVVPTDAFYALYHDFCPALGRTALTELERAEVLAQRGEHALAFAALDGLTGPRAAFLRGICCAHLLRDDEATLWLERANEEAPESLDIIEALVHLSLIDEDLDAAESLVLNMRSTNADLAEMRDNIRYPLHEVLLASGALERADRVAEGVESEFVALLMKAGRALASDDTSRAENLLRRALGLRPYDARPRPLLIVALARAERWVECLREAADLLVYLPANEVARVLGLDAMRKLAKQSRYGNPQGREAAEALASVRSHTILGPLVQRLLPKP